MPRDLHQPSQPMPHLNPQVPLTLLYGDSPFLIEREARALIEARLTAEERAYDLVVLDMDDQPVQEVLAELTAGSLIAGKRVLLVRNIQALKTQDQTFLATALTDLPAETAVVLTYIWTRRPAKGGLPVNDALGKVVKAHGQHAQFVTPRERDLVQWVIGEAKRLGKRLDPQAAGLLVEMAGRDHGALASEIEKLSLYVGNGKTISIPDVQAVAVRSAESTSFELVDAIAEGNTARALTILPTLVPAHNATSAAIPLLGMIARNLRLLWQAAHLAQRGMPIDRLRQLPPELADLLPQQHNIMEATQRSFVAQKLARHARNFTDEQAAISLERVLYADRALKGQTNEHLDARLVIERLVTELCLLSRRYAGTKRR
ncbi:MAG: DNA polymerase III subunit delta [Candidatus Zipacnadales bacterium]